MDPRTSTVISRACTFDIDDVDAVVYQVHTGTVLSMRSDDDE